MGKHSAISWTDATFNPWWGCVEVAKECDNCYARTFDRRVGGAHWGKDAPRRFFGDKHWNEPLRWDRDAHATYGRNARVFCASMADVFEDRNDLDEARARLWKLIEATPNLDWLLLTKRPQNYLRMVPEAWRDGFPSNVWAGTTCGHSESLWRVDALRKVPAAIRWVSVEPMLEDVSSMSLAGIAWAIYGGESGSKRPMDAAWVRRGIASCRSVGAAPFVKQMGARTLVPYYGGDDPDSDYWDWRDNREAERVLVDGREWQEHEGQPPPRALAEIRWGAAKGDDPSEWPPDMRAQEFPDAAARAKPR